MEALTRLVADSLARYGLDRPVDPRRLQWSRWSRCDSPRSLLVVPSKPGIFALAEEIMDIGGRSGDHAGTAGPDTGYTLVGTAECSTSTTGASTNWEEHDFSRAVRQDQNSQASATGLQSKRMLAVLQFTEDDDMAFTLDRMFTRINPMRERLASGRCFLRFVVIEDQAQRRSICAALNQWMVTSAEKASGFGADFSSSLELNVARAPSPAFAYNTPARVSLLPLAAADDKIPASAASPEHSQEVATVNLARALDSGAAKNLHCPHPLPSGF